MGSQQSNPQSSLLPHNSVPQAGYRVMNLQPSINAQELKLNIMTDYIVGRDPRLIDLKKLYKAGQRYVEFDVFSILNYRVRKVIIPIQKHAQQLKSNPNNIQHEEYIQMEEQTPNDNAHNQNKQFTLGINFKLYPKINDTILRISKVFKNSPLQHAQIKKDQYIVGVVEGDFTSMQSFVDLVKLLIHSQFQYITLAVCNSQGITRLHKIAIRELENWKKNYGIGYLGVELAQGWLNKWQLKKHIDAKKKKQSNINIKEKNQPNNKQNDKKSIPAKPNNIDSQPQQKVQIKEEVDFFKQPHDISPQKNKQSQKNQEPTRPLQNTINTPQNKQTSAVQFSLNTQQSQNNLDNMTQNSLQNKKNLEIQSTPPQSNHPQEPQDSTSELSSNQIEQKVNELEHGGLSGQRPQISLIKKSKNVMEISFKDDASTICMCKDYSKHCEKCFKEKDDSYLFFNKKTNRIIQIEKSMLFPKKI